MKNCNVLIFNKIKICDHLRFLCHLRSKFLTVWAVLYACVFASVLIDLFFGIKRAKRLKIVRTSYGYRAAFVTPAKR